MSIHRWIWVFVAGTLALLVWLGRGPVVVDATAGGGGGTPNVACLAPPLPPGADPSQGPVPAGVAPFRHGSFRLTPLATFSIEARVLSREDYTFDAGARLSPTDLALGWGRMADPAVYETLGISQGGRWYRYRWAGAPPIPVREIERSSANMHLVPADDSIAAALRQVDPGQTVRLQGWLVEAHGDDGWRWRSSTRRDDVGDGACELVYVCALSAY